MPTSRPARSAARPNSSKSFPASSPPSIALDILNLFDAKDFDMVYFYESQLPGEPAPVEGIHFHPVHPQTFALNLKAKS